MSSSKPLEERISGLSTNDDINKWPSASDSWGAPDGTPSQDSWGPPADNKSASDGPSRTSKTRLFAKANGQSAKPANNMADAQVDGANEEIGGSSLQEPEYDVQVKLSDIQADPNNPLYSVKSFEDLGL